MTIATRRLLGLLLPALTVPAAILGLAPRAEAADTQRHYTEHFVFKYDLEGQHAVAHDDEEDEETVIYTADGEPCEPASYLPDLIKRLVCWSEYAFTEYEEIGFRMPETGPNLKISVRVKEMDNPPGMCLGAHTIRIDKDIRRSRIPGTLAHEIFHAVQLAHWWPHWHWAFTEGTANAMAYALIYNGVRSGHISPTLETARSAALAAGDFDDFHELSNGDGEIWDFFDLPDAYAELHYGYSMAPIWIYLMEHNATDFSTDYPGVDFMQRFFSRLDKGVPVPVNLVVLMGALHETLLDTDTTLPEEMTSFAFANLVRNYENLPLEPHSPHPYAQHWDDIFLDPIDATWKIDGITKDGDVRQIDLSLPSPLQPTYFNGHSDNRIGVTYGAQYWRFVNDTLGGLIEEAGGLSYDQIGLPYRITVQDLGGVEHFAATAHYERHALRRRASRFYGKGIYFDDDRVTGAGVAVTQVHPVPHYDFSYTVEPYQSALTEYERTWDKSLSPHQIGLLGIENHSADFISIIAYPQEPWDAATGLQMNLRTREGGVYQNNHLQLVAPSDENEFTNYYVQRTRAAGKGAKDLRLDFRLEPAVQECTRMLLTVFDFDVEEAHKPDLLVRDGRLVLAPHGGVSGQVVILNQGTAPIVNARVAVFRQNQTSPQAAHPEPETLVLEQHVSLGRGEAAILEIDHDDDWTCDDVPQAPGPTFLGATMRVVVNTAEGLIGPVGVLPAELTRKNNESIYPLGRACSVHFAYEFAGFVDDLAREYIDSLEAHQELEAQMAEFGAAKTLELMERLRALLGRLGRLPIPIPRTTLREADAGQWFEAVAAWMEQMGMVDQISANTEVLRNMRATDQHLLGR